MCVGTCMLFVHVGFFLFCFCFNTSSHIRGLGKEMRKETSVFF